MKNNIHSFCFCLLLILMITSCKKRWSPTYYYVDNSFRSWVLFQKGTYWIYLNENTQVSDSTFVNEQPGTGWNPPLDQDIDHYQEIGYPVLKSFYTNMEIMSREPSDSYADLEILFPNDEGFVALTRGYTTGTTSGISEYCQLIEKIDTLLLNNNKFINVIHTRAISSYNADLKFDCYFVKNIGLLKFSKQTSTYDSTWTLLRWHVIQ